VYQFKGDGENLIKLVDEIPVTSGVRWRCGPEDNPKEQESRWLINTLIPSPKEDGFAFCVCGSERWLIWAKAPESWRGPVFAWLRWCGWRMQGWIISFSA
jgi:hypothetical protein